jgi:hypothetical protein
MAKEKMPVKFDKPPVRISASGSLSVKAEEIFHSKAGQDVILRMAKLSQTDKAFQRSKKPKE